MGIIAAKLPRLNTIEDSFAIAKYKKYIPTFLGSNSLTIIKVIEILESIPNDFIEISFAADFISKCSRIFLPKDLIALLRFIEFLALGGIVAY
jgi:hypothetical protein|tara:strand:+ start:25 stop:303 length:279 start_codon:yes stop_codon:yes gene_type:complete